jgi:hypothetical protein
MVARWSRSCSSDGGEAMPVGGALEVSSNPRAMSGGTSPLLSPPQIDSHHHSRACAKQSKSSRPWGVTHSHLQQAFSSSSSSSLQPLLMQYTHKLPQSLYSKFFIEQYLWKNRCRLMLASVRVSANQDACASLSPVDRHKAATGA